jgi:hypothetical protein
MPPGSQLLCHHKGPTTDPHQFLSHHQHNLQPTNPAKLTSNMVPQWTNCSLYVHYLIQPPDPPPAQPLAHSTTTPSPTHQSALLGTLPLVYVQLSPTVYQANQPKGPQWSHLQLYNPAQGTIPGLTTGPILNQHLAFPGPKVQDPSGLTPTTWSTILSMPPLVPGPTPTTHPV